MRQRSGLGLIALLGLISLTSEARSDEEKIPVDKLPTAIKKAIEDEFPKAQIKNASKEEEDGVTTFEVELDVKAGKRIDVALKADGTILEIEKEVALDSLPKAVKKGIAAKYPKGKVLKVEEITKGKDGPVTYEVALTTEVVLTAKGKVVKAEDDDDDKKEIKAKKKKKGEKEKDDEDDEDDDKGKKSVEKK